MHQSAFRIDGSFWFADHPYLLSGTVSKTAPGVRSPGTVGRATGVRVIPQVAGRCGRRRVRGGRRGVWRVRTGVGLRGRGGVSGRETSGSLRPFDPFDSSGCVRDCSNVVEVRIESFANSNLPPPAPSSTISSIAWANDQTRTLIDGRPRRGRLRLHPSCLSLEFFRKKSL